MVTAEIRPRIVRTAVRPGAALRGSTAAGLVIVLLVAAALRVDQLGTQPVFIDEDLYTAAVLRLESWSPRSIGRMAAQVVKPPLPLMSQAALARVTGDAVIAGRLLSAGGGVVTTLLTYVLGRRLGGGRASVGLLAAGIYALSPVAVLHERMVLHDGLMAPAALGAVLVGWSAIERSDPRRAALAAGIGFLAVQLKLPAVATVAAPALVVLANLPFNRRRTLVAAIAAAGPLLSDGLLRFSPLGPFLSNQDDQRLAAITALQANSEAFWDAARTYFPATLGALIVLGGVWTARQNRGQLVVVVGMLGVWSVPWLLFSNFAPSRYYLPAVPYLAGLAGVGGVWLVDGLAQRWRLAAGAAAAVVVATLGTLGVLALGVAVDLPRAQLSQLDDWQYRNGWPSGTAYARAAAVIAATKDVDGRVYMINPQHVVAAGWFDPGIGQAWAVDRDGGFPPDARGTLLVMIDFVGVDASGQLVEQAPGQHLDQLRHLAPDFQLVDFFAQPDWQYGLAVLRIRLPAG